MMSVSDMVRDKSFVARLRMIYESPAMRPVGPLLVAPSSKRSDHVGTAFDYLFRIVLARAANLRTPHTSWTADKGASLISAGDDMLAYTRTDVYGEVWRLGRPVRGLGVKRQVWAYDTLARAKRQAAEYHSNGSMTNELIWSCYKLSYLELIVRSGPRNIDNIDPAVLDVPVAAIVGELRGLVELIDLKGLNIQTALVLGPIPNAADLTSGAALDLFVDGWVCDLKVVTRFGDASKWIDQLVLYAALTAMEGFSLGEADFVSPADSGIDLLRRSPEVVGVAVYFARHAEWVRLQLWDFMTKRQMLGVGELLCRRLANGGSGERARRRLMGNMRSCLKA
jgi:hypothetical protein